jgi:hypothetical protein
MWNPWRENLKDTPKESLNWRLWFGVFVFGKNAPDALHSRSLFSTTSLVTHSMLLTRDKVLWAPRVESMRD